LGMVSPILKLLALYIYAVCRARALIFPPGVDLASSRGVVSINAKPKPPIERRRQAGPNGGYCPANTCAGNGGSYANNVRFCSPKNCRR
jgi:hypothetical protein